MNLEPETQVVEKPYIEQILDSIDENNTYSCNIDISMYGDNINKVYSIYEEVSKDKSYIKTGDYGDEYLIKQSGGYTHYVENKKEENKYYKENLDADNVSILSLLKSFNYEDHGELNGYKIYTTNINFDNYYIYELHDFIRIIAKDKNKTLSGNAALTLYIKDDIIDHIEIDATRDAYTMTNVNNVKELKIEYKNFNFNASTTYILPNSFNQATDLDSEYKKIETATKQKKKNSSFTWADRFDVFNILGVNITVGKSTPSVLADAGIPLEFDSYNGEYYALVDSSDYIKLTVVNNDNTEKNALDCVITNVTYSDGGNRDVKFNEITGGDSIATVQAILGEPTSTDGTWSYWSDGINTIAVEFANGYVNAISR